MDAYINMNPNGDKQEQVAKETNIKAWYTAEYPTDECGQDIDPTATFYGLFETLDRHEDVYSYFGVGDSLVRERLFAKLAKIMEVDYDYIYMQWLGR